MISTNVAVAVVCWEGKCLVGRRGADAALAGLWEFPGGKVHADETPAEAAVRECREETGLRVAIERPYPTVEHRYDHGNLAIHFFRCRLIDRCASPCDPFRWVALGELGGYEFPAANRQILAELIAEGQASTD